MATPLRKFVIACVLTIALTTLDVSDEISLTTEDVDLTKNSNLDELDRLACAEDKNPTEGDNLFCSAFDGKQEPCRANNCRVTDRLRPTGKLSCEGQCLTESLALDSKKVPQEVINAVIAARKLVDAQQRGAAAKVKKAEKAETDATQKNTQARRAAEAAATALTNAAAKEANAKAARDKMSAAIKKAMETDAHLKTQSAAYDAAVQVKVQKLGVMKKKLADKKEKEDEWNMQDSQLRDEIAKISSDLPGLKQQLEAAKLIVQRLEREIPEKEARREALSNERAQNKETRNGKNGEGKRITADYMESLNAYIAQKEEVAKLNTDVANAKNAKTQANASKSQTVQEYWQKVSVYNAAIDAKVTAEEASETAQTVSQEAELALHATAGAKARALQERSNVAAFKARVENVYKYAVNFYEKLVQVQQPEAPSARKKIMMLAQDPAMLPCLSSYNVIIAEANGLANSDQVEIVTELKAGLVKVDGDRYSHFEQWCGGMDFAGWVWDWNELEKTELALPIS